MANTGSLANKVIFLTGGSRGIGRAIALKAAKDGAKIILLAKTDRAHPTLRGTLYTVADEIERAGGKALPCVADIRFEDHVKAAVDRGVKEFGGKIDILVNNASAITLTNTSSTPMKTYDLMHSINARGTFLCSKLCLPYLRPGSHILNNSPPLWMSSVMFTGNVAYTMAKYGMSMCVLGMSEELREQNIAVNALWPKSMVWTAAVEVLCGGDEKVRKLSRKPEVMADAAYLVLSQQGQGKQLFTGNFLIDESVLRELGGLTDLSRYSSVTGTPDAAIPTLYQGFSAFRKGGSMHADKP